MVFDTKQTERLRRVLDAMVNDAGPAPDLDRLTDRRHVVRAEPTPRQARRPGVAVAAALAAVMVTFGLIATLTIDDDTPGNEVGAGAEGGFPYLMVDVARLDGDVTLAFATEERGIADEQFTSYRLRTFGAVDSEPTSPRLWMVEVPTGSDFFRGSAFEEPGWDSIPVEQGRAFLKTGPVGSSVMWETDDDPDGEVVMAHGLTVDPSVLVDFVLGLRKDESGWVPQTLPAGFVELYDGPDRAGLGERWVVQIYLPEAARSGGTGEITLELLEGGPTGAERNLYSLLGSNMSEVDVISAAEVRSKPALLVTTPSGPVYQWMETPTVTARLAVQGPIDSEAVLDALIPVDQATWDAIVKKQIGDDLGVAPTTTTTVDPATSP